ncbi:MAG: Ig-like domain-containing protein [Lachnospiraceae bacterium]|nr:Ig-like domain-containing protein [Lachnospiraceae bacterium]
MRTNLKKRLAVFLTIMLVLPAIVSMLPMTATEVSAASNVSVSWYDFPGYGKSTIQVENGQEFNLGYYVSIYDGNNYGSAAMFKKVTYSSSKKAVAAIDSKGVFKAKKEGTTTITVKYKGRKLTCKFEVVKAGAFGESEAITALREASEKLMADMPSKITVANGFKYLQLKEDFFDSVSKYSTDVNNRGFIQEPVKSGNYTYYKSSCKLAVPQAGSSICLNNMLWNYGDKVNPTSTRSSKVMKIASVSANTKQITVKLKKAISAEQILGAQINNTYINEKIDTKKAYLSLSVYDTKEKKYTSARGTITKGSKVLKIQVGEMKYTYKNGSSVGEFKTGKLKKGHTYSLGEKYTWAKNKKVKVK